MHMRIGILGGLFFYFSWIFFGGFFQEGFFGRNSWENFFGRIFWENFLGRNSLFTLLKSVKLFEFVNILSESTRKEEFRSLEVQGKLIALKNCELRISNVYFLSYLPCKGFNLIVGV